MIIRVKMINAFSKTMSCPTRVNNIYDLLLAQTEKDIKKKKTQDTFHRVRRCKLPHSCL